MSENFSEIISLIMTAAANSSLYSSEHPVVGELSQKALEIMEDLYVDDSFSFTLLGSTLFINGELFDGKNINIHGFIRKLRMKGIDKVIVKKGATPKEFEEFVIGLASRDTPRSTANIAVGIIEVKFKSEEDIRGFIDENISKLREVYGGVSRFEKLDIANLDDIVAAFISALKDESNILKMMSPIYTFSDYTFFHITNVAVVTLFFAQSLGLKGATLREAGIAGLLHDVGKMFLSKETLEKRGIFNHDDWSEMKQHPILGATYLSTLPEVPKLAVIAAYEHHMKFDGSGYPETDNRENKQHLISQMVAICDTFDALRSERPYRKSVELRELIWIMREGAGKDFNPMLVDNFIAAFRKINAF